MDQLTLKSKWFTLDDLKWKAQSMEERARSTINLYLQMGGRKPWTECLAQYGCGKTWLGPDPCRDDIAYLTTQRIQDDLGIDHAPSFTFDELRAVIDGALDIPLDKFAVHQKSDNSADSKSEC